MPAICISDILRKPDNQREAAANPITIDANPPDPIPRTANPIPQLIDGIQPHRLLPVPATPLQPVPAVRPTHLPRLLHCLPGPATRPRRGHLVPVLHIGLDCPCCVSGVARR